MKNLSAKEELGLLHRITNAISNTLDLPQLLDNIADLISDELGSDSCLIYLHDEGRKSLVLSGARNAQPGAVGKVGMKVGEGITGWVAAHGKPVAIPQKAYQDARFKFFSNLPEDKYESFLSMPIHLKGQLIGVINLQNKKAHKFSASEISLLTTISKQVAGSIENARLYSEALRKNKQIETISQISRLVAGKSYLDEILRLIVSITAESLGFKICSLMLLNDATNELYIVATQSLSVDYRNKPAIKVKESLSGRAVLERKPISVPNIHAEPEYRYPEIAKQEGLVSFLSLPMMVKDRCIGVLNCYTTEPHEFTETEIKSLAAVGHQAAIAIENTRLMQETESTKEELQTRKLVERAKGILMKEKSLTEDGAFREIQKASMDKRKSMKEIAEAILLSREIKAK